MLVYVVSNNGQPLMPTNRYGKIRRLLKKQTSKGFKALPIHSSIIIRNQKCYTTNFIGG